MSPASDHQPATSESSYLRTCPGSENAKHDSFTLDPKLLVEPSKPSSSILQPTPSAVGNSNPDTLTPDSPSPLAPHPLPLPRSDLGILASVATMDSPLRMLLHRLFAEARSSIQLTMAYFAPDDDLIDWLCRAAKRGAKVQLMLPGQCDVRPLLIAARSFYARLLEAGVEIFERQGCILHAKTMVIDGRISVVGSTNLDYRSIEYNNELSSVIRSETFGQQMQALFENDIGFAKKIKLNEWRRRPLIDRVIQWAVSRARYLL